MGTLASPRRWPLGIPLRISLRTLMLLILVAGGGLGWYAIRRQREARFQRVIATIQASGSSVDFDGVGISRIVWFGGSANPASLPQSPLTPEQVDALGSCDRLKELLMVSSVMIDEGLAEIARDSLIERLYLFKPKITDAGVKHLAGLKSLKCLELLRVPELTDASLAHLSSLTNLEEINLSRASINGSGLVHLARMERLGTLIIPGSAVDDAGMVNLGRLTGLRKLYIGGDYTDAGLTSLAGLSGLTELGIESSRCTDSGLAGLVGLTKLVALSVDGPQVTDAWLDRMAALKSLRNVQIWNAQVSEEAIARLHRALPDIQIFVDGRPR